MAVAWIELPGGDRRLLKVDAITVGRDPSNQVVIASDPKVSRSHAEIRQESGQWSVYDLGSSNGTRVNGRIIERHPLRDGDRIQFGKTTVLFLAGDDPYATEAGTDVAQSGLDLSTREREILALIAQGLKDREIAERLFISASTVRSHLDRIGEKTGLRRRAELTRLAIEIGAI
jgi:pSer/pThr/pTyr-binding forkhead associated (FHA) protein